MSLAKEETKVITMWRAADGVAYNNQRFAEVKSAAHITGFVHGLEELDAFLKKMVSHHDLRTWLLGQIADQAAPKARDKSRDVRLQDINEVCDLPSELIKYTAREIVIDRGIMRGVGIMMEQDGYRLIKL